MPELMLPAKMKGVLFIQKGQAALQDEETPACRPAHLLCQSLYTGLTNGTERNYLVGGNYGGWKWPNRYGYQNVGRVLEVGSGLEGYAAGDVVFSGDSCHHVQYFAAPTGKESLLVKLPAAVNPQHAALFGAASVGLHDVRRANVKLGENVLVVGAGLVGQLTAQAARLAGAVVTVCDLDARRLAIARDLGAHAVITLSRDDTWESVKEAGPFDAVFEDSGAPVLDKLIGANCGQGVLKHRGCVVLVAGRERVEYSFNAAQGYELSVYHAGHFNADDLRQVCRLCAEGGLKIGPVIQDIVKIGQAPGIYDRLRDEPNTLLGTVFDWQ